MIDIEKKEKMTKEAIMTVKKKYISSTYLRNVDKYEYNFYISFCTKLLFCAMLD